MAYGIVERLEDVLYTVNINLVGGQKEGQVYRFYNNFCHIIFLSLRLVYPLYSILETVDKQRE